MTKTEVIAAFARRIRRSTLQVATGEELVSDTSHTMYFSRFKNWQDSPIPLVYKNGVIVPPDPITYTIDTDPTTSIVYVHFSGSQGSAKITADFTYSLLDGGSDDYEAFIQDGVRVTELALGVGVGAYDLESPQDADPVELWLLGGEISVCRYLMGEYYRYPDFKAGQLSVNRGKVVGNLNQILESANRDFNKLVSQTSLLIQGSIEVKPVNVKLIRLSPADDMDSLYIEDYLSERLPDLMPGEVQ